MTDEIQKSIEKPWVVYGVITKFIGRVEKEAVYSLDVRYSEGQLFPLAFWRSSSVQRFKTSGEAIDDIFSKSQEHSREQLIEKVLDDFPEAIRQESYQQIHDILYDYSLRQPKSTESPKDFIEKHCCPNFSQERTRWEDEGGRVISKCPYADAHARLSILTPMRDEGPFGPHPNRRDDGFIHPNKKY